MRVTAATKVATRQRILEAAQNLFAKQGFEATTTRDIAEAAGIATGTLFNYFATKETVLVALTGEALTKAEQQLAERAGEVDSLEEALFAHIARGLRHLQSLRKYLMPLLETSLGPLAAARESDEGQAFRVQHLETASTIITRHGLGQALSPVGMQLYWTLYTGVLAFWINDKSPKQEDTLALIDESLQMFVGWLRREKRAARLRTRKK